MQVRLPEWIETLPEEEKVSARARFLLRYAALYFSREGRLNTLSSACGFHPGSLAALDQVSAPLAVTLEELVGRDVCPRELFRPDLFRTTAEG